MHENERYDLENKNLFCLFSLGEYMQMTHPAVVATSPVTGLTAMDELFLELKPITFSNYI